MPITVFLLHRLFSTAYSLGVISTERKGGVNPACISFIASLNPVVHLLWGKKLHLIKFLCTHGPVTILIPYDQGSELGHNPGRVKWKKTTPEKKKWSHLTHPSPSLPSTSSSLFLINPEETHLSGLSRAWGDIHTWQPTYRQFDSCENILSFGKK